MCAALHDADHVKAIVDNSIFVDVVVVGHELQRTSTSTGPAHVVP